MILRTAPGSSHNLAPFPFQVRKSVDFAPISQHKIQRLQRDLWRDFLADFRRLIPRRPEISRIIPAFPYQVTRYTRFKSRSRGESGRLTVGVHASLSAGNLRATLIEFRHRFPDVESYLVDGSSDHLISDLVASAIDIAFVAEGSPAWDDKSLPVWSERVIVALSDDHPLARRDVVRWADLRHETLLLPLHGPGPEFLNLLARKIGCVAPNRLLRHDASLDRFLTLVGAGWGAVLALEGATGAAYPGVIFREIHDDDGPARLGFHAHWRQANGNPSLRPFLNVLKERYPDFAAGGKAG